MILNAYGSITEDEIRYMSHNDLIEAVLRMLSVKEESAKDWNGYILLPDELADAFRNR